VKNTCEGEIEALRCEVEKTEWKSPVRCGGDGGIEPISGE